MRIGISDAFIEDDLYDECDHAGYVVVDICMKLRTQAHIKEVYGAMVGGYSHVHLRILPPVNCCCCCLAVMEGVGVPYAYVTAPRDFFF